MKNLKKLIAHKDFSNGIFGASRRRVRMATFACIFSLFGLGGLYFSQAATEPRSVQVAVLCGKDQSLSECGGSKHLSNVEARLTRAQKWYKGRLGSSKTFLRRTDSSGEIIKARRIVSDFTVSQYREGFKGTSTSDDDTYRTTRKVNAESRLKTIRNTKYRLTVVVLGFNSMNHCGYTPTDVLDLVIVDPIRGCGAQQDAVYAHEIGHVFGLARGPADYHRSDGTLMNGPETCGSITKSLYSSSGSPSCFLHSDDRSFLLNYPYNRQWFVQQISANAASDSEIPADDLSDIPLSSQTSNGEQAPAPAVAPVMLYKYYSESSIDNLYSTDRNDPAKPSYGYSYQGCVAQIMPTQVSGTIPVYRYYNSANNGAFGGDTLLTGTRDDAGMGNYGYGYVGLVGYIFTSQQAGTVPLKQYFAGAPKTDHFYTTEAWTSGFLDYNYEVSLGYVYPPPADKCGPTDPVPASPNKVVLHHYYNSANIDNFYTVNFNELGYGSDQYGNYKYYGCKAIVWDRQVPGSTPLWRYWNGTGGDHFYTVDRNDAGYAGYGYGIEAVEGYVFRDGRVGGTGAFNRYFAGYPKTDHYYTMDAWTNGFLDYYFERTEAYTYRCG